MKTANPEKLIIDEVFDRYKEITLGFQTHFYWEMLRSTYERTIRDVNALLDGHFSGGAQVKVLEIGSFCGIVSTALKLINTRFDVTAWDLPLFQKDEALQSHYQKLGIACVAGSLADIPLNFLGETFDIIICCEVIEHLNFNPLPVFCEFNRLLQVDGILYIGTPNQANIVKRFLLMRGRSINNPVEDLVKQLDSNSSFCVGLHWREYMVAELVEIIQLTGFRLLKSYYCHTNECRNPNLLRRMLVRSMYVCFPSFLPSQVVIAKKKTVCDITATGSLKK